MQGGVVLGTFGPRDVISDQLSWPKRYRFPQRKRNEDSTKAQGDISVITEGARWLSLTAGYLAYRFFMQGLRFVVLLEGTTFPWSETAT
jgi:hypothetical protein